MTQAMYVGGGFNTEPFPFPLGWYWVGVVVALPLLIAAWYHWLDRRTGSRTPLRGYLVTTLVLAAVDAALPLLAWRVSAESDSDLAWNWLMVAWRLGTFALLVIAVSLGILARIGRSRVLAVVTAVYAAAVCLAGVLDVAQVLIMPTGLLAFGQVSVFRANPFGDPAVLLPAAVLLVSGLGLLLASVLRAPAWPGLAHSHREEYLAERRKETGP